MIYLLTASGLTLCGSSTVHSYTQTIAEQHNETEHTLTIRIVHNSKTKYITIRIHNNKNDDDNDDNNNNNNNNNYSTTLQHTQGNRGKIR
jgi:hypothetical protein